MESTGYALPDPPLAETTQDSADSGYRYADPEQIRELRLPSNGKDGR